MRKIYQISLAVIVCFLFLTSIHAQRKTSGSIPGSKISKLPFNSTFKTEGTTADCDTSNFEETAGWTITYYVTGAGGKDGYVSGTNSYGDKQKANFFDLSSTTYSYTTGCLFYFGKANSNKAANLSKNLIFKVYDVTSEGLPGAQLGDAVEVPLSQIKSDVDGNFLTEIIYPAPIALPASKQFFVSVDISKFTWSTSGTGTRDSISLWGTTADDVVPGQAYEQWSDNDWYDMYTAWSGLNLALAIFPYVSNTAAGCTTLPVNFLSFDGAAKDSKVVLNWSTGNELNNKGFDIERSVDGNNFSAIGFVKAGTATSGKYSFTDGSKFLGGDMYYRLKQIDLDGKADYSAVIKVSIENKFKWEVYPNPVAKNTSLQVQLDKNAKVTVQVVSANGKILQAVDKGLLLPGTYSVPLNLSTAAKGVYFVKLVIDGKTYTKTVVK